MVRSPAANEDVNERSMESGGPSRNTSSDQRNSLSAWKYRFGWGDGGGLAEDPEEESRPTFRDIYMLQNRIGMTMTWVLCGGGAAGFHSYDITVLCFFFACVCCVLGSTLTLLLAHDLRPPIRTISIFT